MRVLVGKVVGGRIVVEESSLREGESVTILAQDTDDEAFELTAEQERVLLTSLREADEGDTCPAEKVLRELGEASRPSAPTE